MSLDFEWNFGVLQHTKFILRDSLEQVTVVKHLDQTVDRGVARFVR